MRHEWKNSHSRTVAIASFAFFYFLNPSSCFLSLFSFSFSIFSPSQRNHSKWPRREKKHSLSTRELLEAFGIERGAVRQEAVSLLFFELVVWWIYDNVYVPSRLLTSWPFTDWVLYFDMSYFDVFIDLLYKYTFYEFFLSNKFWIENYSVYNPLLYFNKYTTPITLHLSICNETLKSS